MGADKFADQVRTQAGIVIPRGERNEKGELLPGETDDAQEVVTGYRERYACVPQFWKAIERAAMNAVEERGKVFACGRDGKIRYVVRGQFLWCILPSGRPLCYALPEIRKRKAPWGEYVSGLSFVGVNSVTRQWQRQHAYGGLLTENVVQAMARDIMASAMKRVEKHGYRLVLTVHDELLAHTAGGSLDEFLELMHVRPRWAAGLPVAAEGWEGERYRK